jgi:outer membrane murein-binding lipoprotein Lpp
MFKETVQKTKYRKRSAAAALIVLSLIAAGCGSAAKNEHAASNGKEAAANEHSGHAANAATNAPGNEAAENHSEHGGKAETANSSEADVKLEWQYSPVAPKSGEETKIELSLSDAAGKPIEKFDVNHEKLMHLIVVSEDLSTFNHIHPDYKGNGKFEVTTAFPNGGSYKLYADFIPTGSTQMTITSQLKVDGEKQAAQPLVKDATLTKEVDGVSASLNISSLKSGQEVDLIYTLNDAKTKKPITDLQPYLGAIGHVVILSEDLNRYLHVHPKEGNESGPTAEFSTSFPEPGMYKIWGQFQRGGKSFIVPFTVEMK